MLAAAALLGPVQGAQALQFNQGDAVLAVYGNATEYVSNLGSFSNLISTGADINLSSIMSTVGTGVKYTIFGYQGTGIYFGNADPASAFSTTQKNQVLPATLINTLINWSGQLAAQGNTASFFTQSDPLSFSSNLNAAGSDSLGGSVTTAHKSAASIDNILNLLQRTGGASTLSTVGTALLSSSTGHLVINGPVSAVPLPAAAVLFGTGVIGLVGVARRRVMGRQ
jgi:hypothetical protein